METLQVMYKKTRMKLKEHLVIKAFLIILVLIICSACHKKTDDSSQDIALLNTILDNSKGTNTDSLYFSSDNSNSYILNIYKDFLELKNDSFINVPSSVMLQDEKTKEMSLVGIKKGDSLYNELKERFTLKIDPLLLSIFSEKELNNFQSQIVENDAWNFEDVSVQGIFEPNSLTKKRKIIHVSKPIYTSDKNYAITYSFKKSIHGVAFIEIYKGSGKNWSRVKTIRTTDFQ